MIKFIKISSILCFVFILVGILSLNMQAMEYNEPPMFNEEVEQGELPTVENRLPNNPKVVKDIDIGNYGGEIALALEPQINGYNWYAANTNKLIGYLYEPLIEAKNPNRKDYEPNLAEEWEIKNDGKTILFKLREGIKWSDGEELTTEDIAFTYNDLVIDEDMPSAKWWAKVKDEFGELVVEDDYNFRFEFSSPNPMFLDWISKYQVFQILPKHNLKEYHPRYNEEMTYEDFTSARDLEHNVVTLFAWVPEPGGSGNLVSLKRNPYYWKVDSEGNQLPYFDNVIARGYDDRVALSLSVVSGDTDVIIDGHTIDALPTALKFQEDRPFTVILEDIGLSNTGPMFNLDAPDPNLRKLFRQQEFIDAVRYGVNRENFKDALPTVDITYGLYPAPGTPFYKENLYTKYEYNLSKAKQLLEEIGIKDYNNDGFRQYPDNFPNPKETVEFQIIADSGHEARLTCFEILAKQYREKLGLKTEMKSLPRELFWERWPYGEWDVWGRWPVLDYAFDQPLRLSRTFGVVGDTREDVPRFHTKGALEEPLDWEIETGKLLQEAAVTVDVDKRNSLIEEALSIFSKKAPMDQIYVEKMWRAIPDENLIGNIPFYRWPEQFSPGHGEAAMIHINVQHWFWK